MRSSLFHSFGGSRQIRIPTLIPVPAGFDDPVKRAAANAERQWDATIGLLGLSAVAAGPFFVLAVPIIAGAAGLAGIFKMRAKWAKEDPPRSDYNVVAELNPLRLDPFPLVQHGWSLPGADLMLGLASGSAHVEAATVSLERALGAQRDEEEILAGQRFAEARLFARGARPVLEAIWIACAGFGRHLEVTTPLAEATVDPESWFDPESGEPRRMDELLNDELLSRVIVAGVPRELLNFTLPAGPAPENLIQQTVAALGEAGAATAQFGQALEDWGSAGTTSTTPRGSPFDRPESHLGYDLGSGSRSDDEDLRGRWATA